MDDSESQKFKRFLSLKRLKKKYNKRNYDIESKKSTNVLYTLRRKLQRLSTNRNKVRTLEDNPKNEGQLSRKIFKTNQHNLVPTSSSTDILTPSLSYNTLKNFTAVNTNNIEYSMAEIRKELLQFGWYWGNLSQISAQKRLKSQPNGSFLVRDSQTEHTFTLSFRSSGVTLHCRINLDKDKYWSYIENSRFPSVVELIEETMRKSESTAGFGFVKSHSKLQASFPVRLTNPIIRFQEVPALVHLTRYVIKRQVASKDIPLLPLPAMLLSYLTETNSDYFDL